MDSDKLQKVFKQLDGLLDGASTDKQEREANKRQLLTEFARFFNVTVDGSDEEEETSWEAGRMSSWFFSNRGRTVTMSACAGWRSLISRNALQPGKEQAFVVVTPHDLRTLAVGVAFQRPTSYVGAEENSFAYQSTGHLFTNGSPLASKPPAFGRGDAIGILVDRKQKFVAFYKNTHMIGVPFMDIENIEDLRLVISCYMGPCSVTVDTCPPVAEILKGVKTFPICIDHTA